MFAAIIIKYVSWLRALPKSDLVLLGKGLVSPQTMMAIWEVVCESLLHRRIFRINKRSGYMHMSLAFGWFLLIVVGWAETVAYLGARWVPLQGHVFFKYFAALNGINTHIAIFDFVMDLLLMFVLSGVALAWYKRRNSAKLGMKRATQHIFFDKIALTALWFVFPVRLIAESITAAIYGGGGFLTGGIGKLLSMVVSDNILEWAYEPIWWIYSLALGVFFMAMPFSRYMHIFTEIPLIFLRHFTLRPQDK